MQNKKLHTVHVISEKLSERLSRTNVKVNAVLIAINNNSMDTLVDLSDELTHDFEDFARMLMTLTKMNVDGSLGLNMSITNLKAILKKMDTKTLYVRTYVATGDFLSLKVIARDYLVDIEKFKKSLDELKK